MTRPEVFLDTDILVAYLAEPDSLLRQLMTEAVCFTSVLNGSELIGITRSDDERYHAESVLWGLKVLGFHHKYALSFGETHRHAHGTVSMRDSMVAGMCIVSDLPLVTTDPGRYKGYKGLSILPAQEAAKAESWNEMEPYIYTV